jgi:hypothetical protein
MVHAYLLEADEEEESPWAEPHPVCKETLVQATQALCACHVNETVDHREVLARGGHQESLGTVDGCRSNGSNETGKRRSNGVHKYAFFKTRHGQQFALEEVVRGQLRGVDDERALNIGHPAGPQREKTSRCHNLRSVEARSRCGRNARRGRTWGHSRIVRGGARPQRRVDFPACTFHSVGSMHLQQRIK